TTVNLPLTGLRFESGTVSGLGAVVVLLGLLAWKLPLEAATAIGSSLTVLIAVFVVAYTPVQKGDFSIAAGRTRIWQSETEWTEAHGKADPRYGWRGQSNETARHATRDFTVTYHFDADGWRRLPMPRSTVQGEIWFLGCSFSFGAGVEDDE